MSTQNSNIHCGILSVIGNSRLNVLEILGAWCFWRWRESNKPTPLQFTLTTSNHLTIIVILRAIPTYLYPVYIWLSTSGCYHPPQTVANNLRSFSSLAFRRCKLLTRLSGEDSISSHLQVLSLRLFVPSSTEHLKIPQADDGWRWGIHVNGYLGWQEETHCLWWRSFGVDTEYGMRRTPPDEFESVLEVQLLLHKLTIWQKNTLTELKFTVRARSMKHRKKKPTQVEAVTTETSWDFFF